MSIDEFCPLLGKVRRILMMNEDEFEENGEEIEEVEKALAPKFMVRDSRVELRLLGNLWLRISYEEEGKVELIARDRNKKTIVLSVQPLEGFFFSIAREEEL